MPFDIEGALREGFDRTIDDGGITVAGAFFVLGALNAVVAAGAANWRGPGFGGPMYPGPSYGMPFALPPTLAGVVSLVAGIATVVVTIAAIRLFVGDDTDRVPQEYFTRNVAWAWVNFFVGSIVFGIVVAIGFVLLFVPGVFLLVSLIFWTVFVAVEDQNFVEALQSSWRLVRGHRWMVFGLGFAVAVITLVVNAVFGGIGVAVSGVVGLLVAQAGSALTTTFSLAVLADAYRQLVAMEADEADEETEAEEAEADEETEDEG